MKILITVFNILLYINSILKSSYGVSVNSDRIHGGIDAPLGFSPHMAALLSRARVFCGGSIVSRKHILTAAHCITPFVEDDQLVPTVFGRVGSNIWHTGGTVVHFKHHHVHPKWDEEIMKYDVGVLELTMPLELNDKVAVIRLDFGWVDGNERCFVTGWGTTWPKVDDNSVNLAPTPDLLQLLFINTLTPAQCEKGISSSPQGASIAPPLNHKVEICTFHSIRHGMCHGDSGSALVSVFSGLQVGVVSWGIPCAAGAPDVHARLAAMKDYLLPILKSCPSFSYKPSESLFYINK